MEKVSMIQWFSPTHYKIQSTRSLQEASCKSHKVNRVVILGNSKRLLTTGVSRWNTRQIALWDQVSAVTQASRTKAATLRFPVVKSTEMAALSCVCNSNTPELLMEQQIINILPVGHPDPKITVLSPWILITLDERFKVRMIFLNNNNFFLNNETFAFYVFGPNFISTVKYFIYLLIID